MASNPIKSASAAAWTGATPVPAWTTHNGFGVRAARVPGGQLERARLQCDQCAVSFHIPAVGTAGLQKDTPQLSVRMEYDSLPQVV
jgi:hypothetical protein